MSKRKADEKEDIQMKEDGDDSSDEDEDMKDIVNVDLDFFDPKPIDYEANKRLIMQLFGADAELFNVSELSDLIIAQPQVGSTVKVDGADSDPFALLTVLNMNAHKGKDSIAAVRKYLTSKCPKKDSKMLEAVTNILSADRDSESGDTALVLSERLINMPVQIMAPMYKMLAEEVEWAVEDGEPFKFSWYVIPAKTYKEVEPTADMDEEDEEERPKPVVSKKKKRTVDTPSNPLYYFHPEDEVIEAHSTYYFDYALTHADKEAVSDSRRVFAEVGIAVGRRVFFVEGSKMKDMIQEIERQFSTT
ncbi:hypothetical protein BZG36_01885 [Bifiguratus adelaidae]|uniref:Protein BCP1 n=1 Tax=Bifiguratus adelaidae TaxID=1938954 RepID=A0A261Y4M1_9FUNG|nr:hypothetical protein BZG36_01885 [Bifiguratus adelaidae]